MWKIDDTRIELIEGDITEFEGDAIVNAANTDLLLGAGVAGAIRRKGGPNIQLECNKKGPIQQGEAVITNAGNLKSSFVIHAASMKLGGKTTEKSLRDSIKNSLIIGTLKGIQYIAFPAIGTGIAGFPLAKSARIILEVFNEYLIEENHNYRTITVFLYSESDFKEFNEIFTNFFTKN